MFNPLLKRVWGSRRGLNIIILQIFVLLILFKVILIVQNLIRSFIIIIILQRIFLFKVFNTELRVFLREHRNGMYRTDVYFLAKNIVETPLFILIPLIFTTICYYSIGLNPEITRYFIACGIIVLMTNAATSFGKIYHYYKIVQGETI